MAASVDKVIIIVSYVLVGGLFFIATLGVYGTSCFVDKFQWV